MGRTIVADALKGFGGQIGRISLPDITKREIWDGLDSDLRDKLVKAGENALKEEWPVLLITDYMEFGRNGNRVHFEDKNFKRRYMLNALIMAECVENSDRFMDKIMEGLYLILGETSWCLPAHNSYERGEKQYPLPDVTRPIIDLFDAESGAEVAIAEYLLRSKLNDICPYISVYVNNELDKRIFTPYLTKHFWWMGDGKQPMLNWTVWCTQNVLLAALSRDISVLPDESVKDILNQAAVSTDYFMDEYGEDGCCDEGAQYYGHAGLCMYNCIDLISQAANRELDSVFEEKIVKNIASYIVKMYVDNNYYLNFADCSPLAGHRGAREFLFGLATKQPVLSSFAAKDYRESDWDTRLLFNEINLYYHVKQALAHTEMMTYPVISDAPEDTFFESTGIMVARDSRYVLAAKAGDNGDNHNHNDVGSVILYKDGKPVLIDLGVGTYTQKTFSAERYDIWTMQSQYHNIPTFLEKSDVVSVMDRATDADNTFKFMQHDGEEYAARDVKCSFEENISRLEMDISPAYKLDKLKRYTRTVELKKDSCVEIHDSYDGEVSAVLSLMSYDEPSVDKYVGDEVAISIKNLARLQISGVENVQIEECKINDERLGQMWKHSCYRILVEFAKKDILIKII